jgi:preprotein translocase subunit SecE
VARQTRAQRRARRAQRAESGDSAAIARPQQPAVRQPVRAAQPETPRPGGERRIPGVQFIGESWAELKKVDWPNQNQIIQATVVVLIACTIVGVYLYGADLVLRRLVEQVFLK